MLKGIATTIVVVFSVIAAVLLAAHFGFIGRIEVARQSQRPADTRSAAKFYWTMVVKSQRGGGFGQQPWETKFFGPYPNQGECQIAAAQMEQQFQDEDRASGRDPGQFLPSCVMRERQ